MYLLAVVKYETRYRQRMLDSYIVMRCGSEETTLICAIFGCVIGAGVTRGRGLRR